MKNHYLALALSVIFTSTGICADTPSPAPAPASAMQEYSYADTGIGFSMPQKPRVQTTSYKDIVFQRYTLDEDTRAFIIEVSKATDENASKVFAAVRDDFLKRLQCKASAEKPITLDGHPGIEFKFEGPQCHGICRIYVAGKNMYQLTSLSTLPVLPILPETDAIFASFHLLKK